MPVKEISKIKLPSDEVYNIKDETARESLATKQNALTWNPTVPTGATTTPLTTIKDGSNYYNISGSGSGIASLNISGTGNAVTNATYSSSTNILSLEKNSTFALNSDLDSVNDKNLYHLGAFDSVSGNVITRQTGYVNVIDLVNSFSQYQWNDTIFEAIVPLSEIGSLGEETSLRKYILSDNANYTRANVYGAGAVDYTVSIINDKLGVKNTNNDINVLKQYLLQHPLIIQYKLATAYTEQVIEDRPLNTLDQSGSLWVREEWEKGLNLGSFLDRTGRWWVTTQQDLTNFINQLPNGTYNISADFTPLSIDSGYNIGDCFFWLQVTGGQYTGDGVHTQINGFTSLNQTLRGSLTFTKENYTNYSFRLWGFGNHSGGNHGQGKASNIMLVEGSHAYTYKEYNGKLARIPYVDKAMYNLGTYDTINGNTITRQTGYLDSKDLVNLDWIYYTGSGYDNFYVLVSNATPVSTQSDIPYIKSNIGDVVSNNDYNNTTAGIVITIDPSKYLNIRPNTSGVNSVNTLKSWILQNNLQLQYKLLTSYTENIIEDRPLNTLNQDGCNWIREEWEKGLNLCKSSQHGYIRSEDGSIVNSNNSYVSNKIKVYANKTYTYYGYSYGTYALDGTWQSLAVYHSSDQVETFTPTVDCLVVIQSRTDNIMLNEGSHAYPYQEYKGAIVREKELNNYLPIGGGIPYITTAPTSANTDGGLKVVVLSEEPATKYDGYIYIIAG